MGQRDAAAAARGLNAVARPEGGHGRDGRQTAGAAWNGGPTGLGQEI